MSRDPNEPYGARPIHGSPEPQDQVRASRRKADDRDSGQGDRRFRSPPL